MQALSPILMMVLMFGVFYFILIRPQVKRQRETQEMLKKLDKGDTIITRGGIIGKITGSNGGWWVTVKLDTVPGAPPREVLAAIPLFDHTYKAGDGEQRVDIDVPDGTTKGVIAYRVTGHGGAQPSGDKACIGGADEFCQRRHHLLVDGKEIDAPAPWRNDCATLCTLTPGPFGDYCKENPCGAISSVRASRANWCPGSLTAPLVYEVPALAKPGKHTFAYAIDNVHSGGSWRVSAVYYAYR